MNDKGIYFGMDKGEKPILMTIEEIYSNRNYLVLGQLGRGMSFYNKSPYVKKGKLEK